MSRNRSLTLLASALVVVAGLAVVPFPKHAANQSVAGNGTRKVSAQGTSAGMMVGCHSTP